MSDWKWAVGTLSGTSVDGIDVALVKIKGSGKKTHVELKDFQCYPFDPAFRKKILSLSESCTIDLVSQLNVELGMAFAHSVTKICQDNDISTSDLEFVASHGQTVYHGPSDKTVNTFQIGEGSIIAYNLNTKVICDFRQGDIAAGGLGAPLLPAADVILHGQRDSALVVLNIGGIANITALPDLQDKSNEIVAFDTGPGNMMMDELTQVMTDGRQDYDSDGQIAKSGQVNSKVLAWLSKNSFIQRNPPKCTGREEFGADYVRKCLNEFPTVQQRDIMATFNNFAAQCVADSINDHVVTKWGSPPSMMKVLVTGGGARNPVTISNLKQLLPDMEVSLFEDETGISCDAREAVGFAILGNETLNNNPSSLPEVTGCKRQVQLGKIIPKPFES